MGKRIYIIAGEASGDLHGGNLVRELFTQATSSGEALRIRAWGGDRMAAAGAEVVKHYRELAFMGFTQVIMNLRTILRNIETCKKDIEAFKPDALIL
ncbi:MAG: lipid-A-disaccharide synthase, partial [Flavobacteriales bacterium]|nr:lipid-A-disaccharide synthase [Flavobacteriales bacterium]